MQKSLVVPFTRRPCYEEILVNMVDTCIEARKELLAIEHERVLVLHEKRERAEKHVDTPGIGKENGALPGIRTDPSWDRMPGVSMEKD